MSRLLARSAKTKQPKDQFQVIAITSPYGSTGKTTVAINLAMELSTQQKSVLLIDAHLAAPSIASHFLLPELPAGLAAALRIANQDRFSSEQLNRITVALPKSNVKLLPGTASIEPELVNPKAVNGLIQTAKEQFDFVIIDLPPRDNSQDQKQLLLEQFLTQASHQILVAIADPIGIFRLLAIEDKFVGSLIPLSLIVNRVRNSVIASAKKEISITLSRLGQLEVAGFLPDDPATIDQALRTAVPASSLSRTGAFKVALIAFMRARLEANPGQLDSRMAKLG